MENRYELGLVSVVMPLYNAEKYVEKAITSVENQTYKKVEIIVVDDCSKDNGVSVVEELAKKYSNIVLLKNEQNKGVALTRNYAISNAKGQYIAFLDSDDVWESNKLESQFELFKKNPGCPLAYTAIDFIDEAGLTIKSKRKVKEIVTFKYLLRHTPIATSTVMIDRFIVGDFEMPNRKTCEDYSLWLTIIKKFGAAKGLNTVLTHYRKTSTSLSSKKSKEIKHFYNVQVVDIKINKISALFNTFCYVCYAFKKHFF